MSDLDVPQWVSEGDTEFRFGTEEAQEARQMVEECLGVAHGAEVVYLGSKSDEYVAWMLLDYLRKWDSEILADRARFIAQVLARHRQRMS